MVNDMAVDSALFALGYVDNLKRVMPIEKHN
ncbi:hypothetical protein ES708_02516 [subsurface metagenome]